MSEFVHKCGELGCPYFKQPSPKNCGCHNTDYQMMNTELTALRARVAELEGDNARLRAVAEDASKALPVLRCLLESAGLAAGVIVAEGMIAHTNQALKGQSDGHC